MPDTEILLPARSMARMETTHRETVEALTAELAKTRRGHGDLLALSRDQVRLSPTLARCWLGS
jgi:hypothetical protein